MRRALPFLALFILAVPATWASGRSRSALAIHARSLAPAATIHTHAPSIFPKAHLATLNESGEANTRTVHQNSFAGYVVRTMLGFSARFTH